MPSAQERVTRSGSSQPGNGAQIYLLAWVVQAAAVVFGRTLATLHVRGAPERGSGGVAEGRNSNNQLDRPNRSPIKKWSDTYRLSRQVECPTRRPQLCSSSARAEAPQSCGSDCGALCLAARGDPSDSADCIAPWSLWGHALGTETADSTANEGRSARRAGDLTLGTREVLISEIGVTPGFEPWSSHVRWSGPASIR